MLDVGMSRAYYGSLAAWRCQQLGGGWAAALPLSPPAAYLSPQAAVAPLQVVLPHVVLVGRVPFVRLDARAVDHRREALAAVRRPRDDEPAARLERVRVDVGLRRRVPVGGRRRVLLLRALLARHADGRQCSAASESARRCRAGGDHAQAGALRLLAC